MPRSVPTEGLPRFLVRGRRGLLAGLIGTGTSVALLSAGTARLVSLLSHAPTVAGRVLLVVGLLALIAGVAGLRVLERFLAERLGQDYVHEIRKELIRSALAPGRNPSLGVTVARTSNDLNSVRNWVTLGIASAVSGIPLILVLTVALWLMAPPLAVAVMAPLVAAAALLGFLARPTLARAAALRKSRGRLAGQITDVVNAATAIRAGGGEEREVTRIDKLGREVAASAVRRATLAGSLRASAAAAASATAVAVAAVGAFIGLDQGHIAAALTVVSMIATPIHDLGRVVEFRQSYVAARNVIAPALSQVAEAPAPAPVPRLDAGPLDAGPGGVVVSGLSPALGPLRAVPGQCILVRAEDHAASDRLFAAILGSGDHRWARTSRAQRQGADPQGGDAPAEDPPRVVVDGHELAAAGPSQRRRLVGYAARGLALERGQLGRAIRYRRPAAGEEQLAAAIARASLADVVSRLPRGAETVLRRGGEPLSVPERAKVQLARATLGDPPLLLLDRIDADLDADGRSALRRILEDYPGIAIVATDHPDVLPEAHAEWHLDAAAVPRSRALR